MEEEKSNLFYRNQVESTPPNVKYNGTPLHEGHFYYGTNSSLENEWLGRNIYVLMLVTEPLSKNFRGTL